VVAQAAAIHPDQIRADRRRRWGSAVSASGRKFTGAFDLGYQFNRASEIRLGHELRFLQCCSRLAVLYFPTPVIALPTPPFPTDPAVPRLWPIPELAKPSLARTSWLPINTFLIQPKYLYQLWKLPAYLGKGLYVLGEGEIARV
jgi:hypothetical protein